MHGRNKLLNVASNQLQYNTLLQWFNSATRNFSFASKYIYADQKEVSSSHLLLQRVVSPDHVPSALHERCRDPAIWYPLSQEKEAREPNKNPHEREVMAPCIGAWRIVQDFPVNQKSSVLSLEKSRIFKIKLWIWYNQKWFKSCKHFSL